MKEQKNWGSLKEVFQAIESVDTYCVMRNFEDMTEADFYMKGHDDIDILCTNQSVVKAVLDSRNNKIDGSQDHVLVKIRDIIVKFGLRYVGDGYYTKSWERKMLQCRIMHANGFYIMAEDDYFYSLLYHALLQKGALSSDYRMRLKKMGFEMGIDLKTDSDYYTALYSYLKCHQYLVEYPHDSTVLVNYKSVPQELQTGKGMWYLRKIAFFPRRVIGKLVRAN